jgi:hypothetical protein
VQPGQHLVLGVGLPHVDVEPKFLADLYAHLGQVGVARDAVDVDLPAAEASQIGTVQHVHLHAADTSA